MFTSLAVWNPVRYPIIFCCDCHHHHQYHRHCPNQNRRPFTHYIFCPAFMTMYEYIAILNEDSIDSKHNVYLLRMAQHGILQEFVHTNGLVADMYNVGIQRRNGPRGLRYR